MNTSIKSRHDIFIGKLNTKHCLQQVWHACKSSLTIFRSHDSKMFHELDICCFHLTRWSSGEHFPYFLWFYFDRNSNDTILPVIMPTWEAVGAGRPCVWHSISKRGYTDISSEHMKHTVILSAVVITYSC